MVTGSGSHALESHSSLCAAVGSHHRSDRTRLGSVHHPDGPAQVHEERDALHCGPGEFLLCHPQYLTHVQATME